MSGNIITFDGTQPTIAGDAFIAPSAYVIGKVTIGAGSGVWFNCLVRGDVNTIDIGDQVNIQDGTVIHVNAGAERTLIGSRASIGHSALLHGCTLEEESFVGMKAVVMDRCVIESGGMLAAGALLPPGKRIKSGELWLGWPAKLVREVSEQEREHLVVGTWQRYAALAQKYRGQGIGIVGASPAASSPAAAE